MLIHEYQGKEFLRRLGIKVPAGKLASSPEEVKEIALQLSGPVILKSQVLSGGRGKAGGIIFARNAEEAGAAAQNLFGKKLITTQSGQRGLTVKKILVEKALKIKREIYLGLTVDRKKESLAFMVSPAGGMEIEEISRTDPGLIKKEYFSPELGLLSFQARNLTYFLELPENQFLTFIEYLKKLTDFFLTHDLKLLEINPLVLSEEEELFAADVKMDFDDCSLFRQPEISALEDLSDFSQQEIEARRFHLNYLKMDGNIGCLVNGAGLAMATMDIIKYFGGQPANFLDIGGGVTEEAVSKAFEILIEDPQVISALINIFGGIVRCDLVARGIVSAAQKVSQQKPVVIRMEGTNIEEGKKILEESGLPFYFVNQFEEAARLAVTLSKS